MIVYHFIRNTRRLLILLLGRSTRPTNSRITWLCITLSETHEDCWYFYWVGLPDQLSLWSTRPTNSRITWLCITLSETHEDCWYFYSVGLPDPRSAAQHLGPRGLWALSGDRSWHKAIRASSVLCALLLCALCSVLCCSVLGCSHHSE